MQPELLIVVYCVIVAAASLVGGWIPFWVELTHARMQCLMSFVGGLMLGVGLFHMLGHAVGPALSLDSALVWLMAGLLTMYFLQRFLHFHQHGPGGTDPHCELHGPHEHAADEDHGDPQCAPPRPRHLNWVGVALGLALHTILDGVALAAAIEAESHGHDAAWLYGLGALLAIALHKPLDAMAVTSLLAAANAGNTLRQAVNFGLAALVPVGAAGFYLGIGAVSGNTALVVACALAFSAGMFICISLSDLLPEIEFHSHDRIKLSVLLLLGIAAAYSIGFLETGHHGHRHGTTRPGPSVQVDHAHGRHDHTHDGHDHNHEHHDH